MKNGLALAVLLLASALAVPDGGVCGTGADCDNWVCLDSDGGLYPGNGVDLCNSTGWSACGTLCDFNNSVAVEIITSTGICSRKDDNCTIDSFYFAPGSNTTWIPLYADVSCQCGQPANCTINLTDEYGNATVYETDSGALQSGYVIYNPPVNQGTNRIKANCTCEAPASTCQAYTSSDATVRVNVSSIYAANPVSPGYPLNTSIMVRNDGRLGIEVFVDDFFYNSTACLGVQQHMPWYTGKSVVLNGTGNPADTAEFTDSLDANCTDVRAQYSHLVRVVDTRDIEESQYPSFVNDFSGDMYGAGVYIQNWTLPSYPGRVLDFRLPINSMKGDGCDPVLYYWICTDYDTTPYDCWQSSIAWGVISNSSLVPESTNIFIPQHKNASFAFTSGQQLGVMVSPGGDCDAVDCWTTDVDFGTVSGSIYYVPDEYEDSNTSWSPYTIDVAYGLTLGVVWSNATAMEYENVTGGCFSVRDCYDYGDPFIDSRLQCWTCGDGKTAITEYACVSDSYCCRKGETFSNGACCPEGQTCCTLDSHCQTDQYCDTTRNSCANKGVSGYPCMTNSSCISSHCDHGYCCEQAVQAPSKSCEVSDGFCRCCRSSSDCGIGYFCDSYAKQCVDCSVGAADGLCDGAPSTQCLLTDVDCCDTDAGCAASDYCDNNALVCRACTTKADLWCPSPRCIGTDPDCCDSLNPCSQGDCNPSTYTCEIALGNACKSDSDCVVGSCKHDVCTLSDFLILQPAVLRVNLRSRAFVTVTVVNYRGQPVHAILTTDSPIARFVNRQPSMSVSLAKGEVRQVPLIIQSNIAGAAEITITAQDSEHSDITVSRSLDVVVSGQTSADQVVTAPESLNLAVLLVLYGLGIRELSRR